MHHGVNLRVFRINVQRIYLICRETDDITRRGVEQ